MSTVVDELLLKIGLDVAELEGKLKVATSKAKKAADSMASGFNKMGDTFITQTAQIGKWSAAIAGAAAGSLALLTSRGIAAASAIKETADSLGYTANGLRALTDAAEDYGITSQKLNRSLFEFNASIAEAGTIGSETGKKFREVGLDAQAFAEMLPEDRMLALADAIKNAKTESERMAIAQTALGAQGAKMVGWLSQGSAGLKEQYEGFKKLNGGISELDFEKIEGAKRTMGDFGDLVDSVGMSFASGFSNAIKFAYSKIETMIERMGGFGAITEKVQEITRSAIKIIGDGWQGLNIIWDAGKVVFLTLSEYVWKFIKAAVVAFEFWGNKLGDFWTFIKSGGAVAFEGLKLLLTGFKVAWMKTFAYLTEVMARFLSDVAAGLQATGIKGLTNLGRATDEVAMKIRASFGGMSADASRDWDGATDRMKKASEEFANASSKAFTDWSNDVETPQIDANIDKIIAAKERAKDALKADADMSKGTLGTQLQNEYDAFAANEDEKVKKAVETSAKIREIQVEMAKSARSIYTPAFAAYLDDLKKRREHAEEMIKMEEDDAAQKVAREEYLATRIKEIQADRYQREREMELENVALWESGWKGKMEVMSSFLGQMSTLMETNSKSMFKVGQAAAIAQTTIDTYTAAMAAYKSLAGIPIVGPAMGAAAAAAAIATGMKRISDIKKTKFGGTEGVSASGGSSGGGGTSQQTQQAPQQTTVGITLIGDRFGDNQVRSMLGRLGDALGDNVVLKVS